jgi:urease accessory protein
MVMIAENAARDSPIPSLFDEPVSMKRRAASLALLLALLYQLPVAAHPGHGIAEHGGLTAGLTHPWHGLDHLLMMLAVGVLGVQIGGRARWGLPIVFAAALVTGFATGGVFTMASSLIAAGGSLCLLAIGVALCGQRIGGQRIGGQRIGGQQSGGKRSGAASQATVLGGLLAVVVAGFLVGSMHRGPVAASESTAFILGWSAITLMTLLAGTSIATLAKTPSRRMAVARAIGTASIACGGWTLIVGHLI